MAPADDSLAGELPVPEVGRRDGVGVCASIGTLLSTGGVAPVEVKEEVEGYRVSLYSKREDWGHWVKADVIANVVWISYYLTHKEKLKIT